MEWKKKNKYQRNVVFAGQKVFHKYSNINLFCFEREEGEAGEAGLGESYFLTSWVFDISVSLQSMFRIKGVGGGGFSKCRNCYFS